MRSEVKICKQLNISFAFAVSPLPRRGWRFAIDAKASLEIGQ
jgi:hypothetical protein